MPSFRKFFVRGFNGGRLAPTPPYVPSNTNFKTLSGDNAVFIYLPDSQLPDPGTTPTWVTLKGNVSPWVNNIYQVVGFLEAFAGTSPAGQNCWQLCKAPITGIVAATGGMGHYTGEQPETSIPVDLIFVENSLSVGVGESDPTLRYPTQVVQMLTDSTHRFWPYIKAAGGHDWQDAIDEYPGNVAPLYVPGKLQIVIALEYTNDLVHRNAVNSKALAVTYCNMVTATGFKTLIVGVLPANQPDGPGGTFASQRTAVNVAMAADFPNATSKPRVYTGTGGITYALQFIAIEENPQIGDEGDQNDSVYYADGVHPRGAGYALIANDVANGISLFL